MRLPMLLVLLAAAACGGDGPTDPPAKVDPDAGRWTQVTAGGMHTCALTASGTGYCWGANGRGQLGRADTASHAIRPILTDVRWTRLTAGGAMACGIDTAGATHCWGVLPGIGYGNAYVPRPIESDPGFRTLEAGGMHLCGIARDDRAWCWGDNFRGQVGAGIIGGVLYMSFAWPMPVASTTPFRSLAPSEEMTCALSATGAHHCWGGGTSNGSGTVPGSATAGVPTLDTLVVGGTNSREHQCGIDAAGAIHCFGWNMDGQVGPGWVGAGAGQNYVPPTRIPLPGGARAAAVTVGGDSWIEDDVLGPGISYSVYTGHTCALSTDGEAFCWGSNRHGQLGDGTTTMRYAPVRVLGGHRFVQLDAGGNHTCGITTALKILCWGSNRHGQLASGTRSRNARALVPTPVED